MVEYLTAKQVAKYLQAKPFTVYQWARTKKIPAVKLEEYFVSKRRLLIVF